MSLDIFSRGTFLPALAKTRLRVHLGLSSSLLSFGLSCPVCLWDQCNFKPDLKTLSFGGHFCVEILAILMPCKASWYAAPFEGADSTFTVVQPFEVSPKGLKQSLKLAFKVLLDEFPKTEVKVNVYSVKLSYCQIYHTKNKDTLMGRLCICVAFIIIRG